MPRTLAALALALAAAPRLLSAQSTTVAAADTLRTAPARAVDVRFMQGMIGHHAQALEMAALVPARSRREDLRLLAERITVSQRDEIARMTAWLRERGQAVPDTGAPHAHHDMPGMHHMADTSAGASPAMPGMLTPRQLAQLAERTGSAFERAFLEAMIRHHEGALTMVRSYFATPGAGQDAQMFSFASDVDTDQRAEIARMRALLARMPAARAR